MPERPSRENSSANETDTPTDSSQHGDPPAGSDTPSDTATDSGPEVTEPVSTDVKAAFAAALERKKQAGQSRAAHLDGHGGVGGATASHKATRTFRRKSG